MIKHFLFKAGSTILLGVALTTSLSGCATAIPTKPLNNGSTQPEEKSTFNDKLASSELTKIQHLIESKHEKGASYQEAGDELRNNYQPANGVEWEFTVAKGGKGYILKVWTPSGGSFVNKEDAMEVESYDEVPEEDTAH